MAVRLLSYVAMQHVRSSQQLIVRTHGHMLLSSELSAALCITNRARLLHVKVLDKDAGMEAQREFNKEQQEQDAFNALRAETRPGKRHLGQPQILKTNAASMEETLDTSDDADTFGNTKLAENEVEDEGDKIEEEFIGKPPRRIRKIQTKEYASLIKNYLDANRLKNAIEVLEQQMLKEDRVKPDHYIYNLLIGGCARAGQTRKAFSLFTRMRQRGLKVTGGTYTSLFNACANAPSAKDGLERAQKLRETVLEKGYELNAKNYHAMIKAYGRCGDVKTAFLLVDEMMEKKLTVGTETFNFLLQACASDAEFGFRHCLLTWHKMLQRNIKPDYHSFSTVLRCVRDCGFGDLPTMQKLLQKILKERKEIQISLSSETPQILLTASANAETAEAAAPTETKASNTSESLQIQSDADQLEIPNLLARRPHLGSLVALSEVNSPHERFLLLGGLTGFLELMKQNNITPNIQMFTTMLEVVPPTYAAEKQIITFIRKIGLKADIDFFNVLIKKRSMRYDYEGAKEVLSMIRTAGLHPDIVTYGVLALSCETEEAARELLQQMEENGIRMNIQILGAMLRQGCVQRNFSYACAIMQISLDERIKPNEAFLRHLNVFYDKCARAIDARHGYTKKSDYKQGHAKFCRKLRLYYDEHGLTGLKLEDAIKKIKERPHQQLKEDDVEGLEPVKNEAMARKQKLRKYISKIKVQHLRDDPVKSKQPTLE